MTETRVNQLMKASLIATSLVLSPQLATAANAPSETAAGAAVQLEAVQAMDKMAAYLRGLKSFTLTAETRQDNVLSNGQKLEVDGESVYKVRGNDRLFVSKADSRATREFFYNGKTLTQFDPSLALYATIDAPATTVETLDMAVSKFGMEIPLADLFYWGTPRSNVKGLSSAIVVGESKVDGNVCNQYAFRTGAIDFQVWIRKDGDPLTCKVVITDNRWRSRPQYGATLSWSLNDTFDDKTFEFVPPAGATEIKQVVDSTN